MSEKQNSFIQVEHLQQYFPAGGFGKNKKYIQAVDDVSFTIGRGETLGLVGESGSGKSTVARCIMNIDKPEKGRITYKGIDLCDKRQLRANKKCFRQDGSLYFRIPTPA